MKTWNEYKRNLNEAKVDIDAYLKITQDLLKLYDNGAKTAKVRDGVIEILSSKGDVVAYIDFKGKKYIIYSPNGRKIISGMGNFEKSIITLLEQYWYAIKTK